MAPRKVTKKVLEVLEKAELRKVIIIGMKLDEQSTYALGAKDLAAWVLGRLTEVASEEADKGLVPLVDADLTSIPEEIMRPGVIVYLEKLKLALAGKGAIPSWPPEEMAPEKPDNTEQHKSGEDSDMTLAEKKKRTLVVGARTGAFSKQPEPEVPPVDTDVQERLEVVEEAVGGVDATLTEMQQKLRAIEVGLLYIINTAFTAADEDPVESLSELPLPEEY